MKNKRKLNKKLVLSIAGVVVLVVVALVIGVLVRNLVVQDNNDADKPPRLPASVDDVQKLRVEGKDEESGERIDESLNDSSTDDDTRYMLYLQKGHIAYDKKQWSAAAESYLEAEELKETAEVAELLANVYAGAKENSKAIEYFKKAIRLTSQDNPRYGAIKESFEARIKSLEEQS